MNVFVILAMVGLVALAWLWSNKSRPKNTPARTWARISSQDGRQAQAHVPL